MKVINQDAVYRMTSKHTLDSKYILMPLQFHQKNVTPWPLRLPMEVSCAHLMIFSVALYLHSELIWSQWWQLSDTKAEHKNPGGRTLPETSARAPELMDCISTKAGEDTVCRLWGHRVGRISANGASAPPFLATPHQNVSMYSVVLELDNILQRVMFFLKRCQQEITYLIAQCGPVLWIVQMLCWSIVISFKYFILSF